LKHVGIYPLLPAYDVYLKICYNHRMDKLKIKVPRAKIAGFCKRWKISEFAIFGSALRADFSPDSDVDVLISFAPQANVSLFDMVHMQDELRDIFGREVDLISKRGLDLIGSRNYLRRKMILDSAEVLHVA
jgi:predicted nucleotidyltransferase